MKIISIQVGRPTTLKAGHRTATSAINKAPVSGPVMVRTLNLEGDEQADLGVHGGADKAVYAYSFDVYPAWKQLRPDDEFAHGALGENLTVDTLPEDTIYRGDVFEAGEALLQAVQPRFPCYKLAMKYDDPKILKQFMTLRRPGVYFRVLREGMLQAGDELRLVTRAEPPLVSILELFDSRSP